MAFKLAEAYVEFSQRGAQAVRSAAGSIGGIFKGITTNVSAMGVALTGLATGGAIHTLMGFVEAAAEAEKQTAKLEAVLAATKNASGLTVQQLEDLASELQNVTAFEDDTVKAAEAVLLTFKKIGGETFPRAIEAAADLATVFETDLSAAATMVGKALEDPIRGITALRRVGVSFSKDQEEVIKKLVQTGEVAKAQAAVLREIEGQVGGSARRVGDTTFGKIEQFKNALGDLAEEVGGALVPVVKDLTVAFRGLVEAMQFMPGVKYANKNEALDRFGAIQRRMIRANSMEQFDAAAKEGWALIKGLPAKGVDPKHFTDIMAAAQKVSLAKGLPAQNPDRLAAEAAAEAAARNPQDPIARMLKGDRIFGEIQDAVSNWERLSGSQVDDLAKIEKVAKEQLQQQIDQTRVLKEISGRLFQNAFSTAAQYQ